MYIPRTAHTCTHTHTHIHTHIYIYMFVHAMLLSCVQLWNLMDYSPLGSSVRGTEYRSGLSRPPPWDLFDPGIKPISPTVCCAVLSCWFMSDSSRPHGWGSSMLLCPWIFSRQEYLSGLPCLSPGDLPNPGIEPASPMAPALQANSVPVSQRGSYIIHRESLKAP